MMNEFRYTNPITRDLAMSMRDHQILKVEDRCYPSTRLHALGNWSVALKKGLQPFKVVWCDFRTDAAQRLNLPGIKDYVWTEATPDLRISGPGLDHQPLPAAWMCQMEVKE